METSRVLAFKKWLATARPGQVYNYFTGYLALARGSYVTIPGADETYYISNPEIDGLATLAIDAWQNGRVHLFQRKLRSSEYEYLAMKRYQPAPLWLDQPMGVLSS